MSISIGYNKVTISSEPFQMGVTSIMVVEEVPYRAIRIRSGIQEPGSLVMDVGKRGK